eukprot:jgi/Ulvmu1/10821/UM069_0057.1
MASHRLASMTLQGFLALGYLSLAMSCSCLTPPNLSECGVSEGQAALLVDVTCQKTIQCNRFSGTSVSDVEILTVFEDKTDLMLKAGDVVSIESSLDGAFCGFSLAAKSTYIVFAQQKILPPTTAPGLSEIVGGSNTSTTASDVDLMIAAAAENSACDMFTAQFTTNLCSGNIIGPTDAQTRELARGCRGA